MSRVSWDKYFIDMLEPVSRRSTCIRRKVSAIIVKDNRIIATGYNGSPTGVNHCNNSNCIREQLQLKSGESHHLCRGLHAEQNSLLIAGRFGVSVAGGTIYVNTKPCSICIKMIINAGISRIVYVNDYTDKLADDILKETDIEICQIVETDISK